MKNHILIAGIATLMLASCAQKNQTELTLSGLNPTKFQTVVNDAQTDLYTLKNKAGMEVCIPCLFGGSRIVIAGKNLINFLTAMNIKFYFFHAALR